MGANNAKMSEGQTKQPNRDRVERRGEETERCSTAPEAEDERKIHTSRQHKRQHVNSTI